MSLTIMPDGSYITSIIGCARCRGDGHDNLRFLPFTFAVENDDDSPAFTHYCPCPANGEPILLRVFDAPEVEREQVAAALADDVFGATNEE